MRTLSDETLFLISTLDPWYEDLIVYLQTQNFSSELYNSERHHIQHQSQPYRIIGNTFYHVGFDYILRRCLTLEKAERVINDCHSGACGGHMFRYATAHKILHDGYFWPSIFKDCILVVKNVMLARFMIVNNTPHPHPYTWLLPSTHLLNLGLISRHVTLSQLGGMVISSSSLITLLNGPR